MKLVFLAFAMLAFSDHAFAQWERHDPGTKASFRGLDVVSKDVVWASGTGGTVIRTVDGGKNWKVIRVPGAEKLDFRDIEAFGKEVAYVLSIGTGDQSRIYKTIDGGERWELQFKNSIEGAFFDSIAFWDENHGIAQSDPVDGRYVFYETKDGTKWTQMDPESMPAAKDGEAAFAASGSCIITNGEQDVFLITGGKAARVFFSADRGRTWSPSESPLISGGDGTGIFGIAISGKHGVIVGGDYTKPTAAVDNLAFSNDGGITWKPPSSPAKFGYRSGVAFVEAKIIVVVGITGSDISYDGGATWKQLDSTERNTVAANGKSSIWAVGPGGEVSRLNIK